ncbi:MAG: hypothetical protein K9L02_05965 [Acholeplasmataceae bacterium]|nr:hypothetical protein [Acholeplasmataceae bacterium]
MKSLIVLYSKTGNTLGVGKRLAEAKGFDIKEVTAMSDDPNNKKPELVEVPDIIGYDHLIFGSPVHGFNLSQIMHVYLSQLPDLTGKTIDLFITHFFPYAWMGGTRTLKQMKQIVETKNGKVGKMTSINWKSKKRELVISEMIKAY